MDKARAKKVHQILGAQLRQKRNNEGVTQDDVAVAIGVDRRHYGRIEAGQSRSSLVRLIEICEALNLEPGALIQHVVKVLNNES